MNLTSFVFAGFCIISILIYFVMPKKIKWIVLLVSSLCFLFYKNFNIVTIIQALIVFLSAYIFGRLIEKYNNTKKQKIFLLIGVLSILLVLVYFKYSNLFIVTLYHLCNIFQNTCELNYVNRNSLIGLSYYSLIMVGYLIDVYRGGIKSEKNPFKLALFMTFFPILSSGPFIRYNDIKDKLYESHKFNFERMCSGLVRILWGLFKILVISQRVGFFVDGVYGDYTKFNGLFILTAALMFPIQLYTNFSGSIDIIMGVSEIIGIELPENFKAPFFSKTITEFWRNWHITLGEWLKDYIFYPLLKSEFMQKINKLCKEKFGKKVGKKVPLFISMFIMWIAIGIWHGGTYTFIIATGLLQFIYIFFEDILGPCSIKLNKKLGIKTDVFSYKLYQIIRTYLLFSFSMLFFRANSLANAMLLIKNIFPLNILNFLNLNVLYTAGLDRYDFLILIISLVILFIVELLSRSGSVREKLFNQNIVFRWIILFSLIFFIIIFGCYGVGFDPANFIYRGF